MILITGVAGFIGSNVARALSRSGRQIAGSDRLRSGTKWRNLVQTQLFDLVTPENLFCWLNAHVDYIEHILHFGAVSDTTETDVDRIVHENIRLSLDLWAWSAKNQVSMIYASSAATFGDGSHGFTDNEDPNALRRLRPLNAYAWSKQLVDSRFVFDVTTGRRVPRQWAGLKFFNVYGPGEDHKGNMRSLITKMLPVIRKGGSIELFKSYDPQYADGAQLRDFIYIDDVVSVVEWILDTPLVSGLFNVGSGVARTWNDVVRVSANSLGRPARIKYVDMPIQLRKQYQYFTQAPLDKLRAAGWAGRPASLEEGIARYVEAIGASQTD